MDKHLGLAIYPPELLPVVSQVRVLAGKAERILDLKLKERPVQLGYKSIEPKEGVFLKIRVDNDIRPDVNTAQLKPYKELETVRYTAKKELYTELFNTTTTEVLQNTALGLWVLKPTISEKMLFGIELTDKEKALTVKYGVDKTFEKGILPIQPSSNPSMCLGSLLEREYQILREEILTFSRSIRAGGEEEIFSALHPQAGTFFVIKEVALEAANIILKLVRESVDAEPLEIDGKAMSLDFGVPSWLHVFNLFLFKAYNPTTAAITAKLRIKLLRCRLSNLIRTKILDEDIISELTERVRLGIW